MDWISFLVLYSFGVCTVPRSWLTLSFPLFLCGEGRKAWGMLARAGRRTWRSLMFIWSQWPAGSVTGGFADAQTERCCWRGSEGLSQAPPPRRDDNKEGWVRWLRGYNVRVTFRTPSPKDPHSCKKDESLGSALRSRRETCEPGSSL